MRREPLEVATQPGMKSNCTFCRIINSELAAHHVFEDEHTIAFLDHRPLFPGHCLLVPKLHADTLLDLDDGLVQPLFTNARKLARAVEKALQAEGTFIAINNKVSQSVPHLHVHVVPRRKGDGLKGFFWPRHPYRDEAHIHSVQASIRQALAQ